MALEEMSELAKELCKTFRVPDDKVFELGLADKIREEIADVKIMMYQLELYYGDTSEWEEKKLARLEAIMNRDAKNGSNTFVIK